MDYKKLNHILWILPFIFFLGGYYFTSTLIHVQEITVPRIVGQSLADGVKALSAQQLNVRILAEVIDHDLPDGTIMRQNPGPNTRVKPQHSIFLVSSVKPQPPITPSFIYKQLKDVSQALDTEGIKYKVHMVPAQTMPHTIVAQHPQPGDALNPKRMCLYVAQPAPQLSVLPNLTGMRIPEATEFLQLNGIDPDIRYEDERKNRNTHHYVVTTQKPLDGTIVDLGTLQQVHLVARRKRGR